jgi:hypothetical protein
MKYFNLLAISSLVCFLSCKNKTSSNDLNNTQPVNTAAQIEELDSLDIDTSAFIITNLPEPVKEILYKTSHKLLEYALESYAPVKNGDSLFSVTKLKELTLPDSFSIDTSSTKIVFWKNSFNKRQVLEYSKNKDEIKIFIGTQLWFDGKKYQVTWIRLLSKKKDETVYDDF